MGNDKKDSVVKRDVEAERKMLEKAEAKWIHKPGMDQHMKPEEKPFNIEPFSHERQRLPFKMTDQDRHRRERFLEAQTLSEREPVRVNELERLLMNPIRRLYLVPCNKFFNSLIPTVGAQRAATLRFMVPKLLLGYAFTVYAWYNIKYKRASWETSYGWTLTVTNASILPGQPAPPPKDHLKDYKDEGFSMRTSHRGPQYAY